MSDTLQKSFNSTQETEDFIRALHPDQEIVVIKSRAFYYVESPGGMIRVWETLLYDGKASGFKW